MRSPVAYPLRSRRRAAPVLLSIALPLVCLASMRCAAQPAGRVDTTGTGAALGRSRAATLNLLTTLRTVLAKEITSHGAVFALDVCADTAQLLTETVEARHHLTIRRVSHRWRNALNEPDPFERDVLDIFARARSRHTLTDTTEEYRIVVDHGGRVFRYMRPIITQDLCLTCHGDRPALPGPLQKVISERYPDDHATGFRTGDLRGAVSVRLRLD